MKLFRKSLALLMALLIVVSVVPVGYAANSEKTVTAGSTVTVYFSYSDIFGVDGTFSLDDSNSIVESWKVGTPSAPGMSGSISGVTCFLSSNTNPVSASNVTIPVILTIRADAAAGKTAVIKFDRALCINELGTMSAYETDTITVKLAGGNGEGPTEEAPEPGKDNTSLGKVDYSELERQIAIANGLSQSDYTSDSWAVLENALAKAQNALSSKNQDTVDSAARELASAIAALVKMDYSALLEALAAVENFAQSNEIYELWLKLADAVNRGKLLLNSGDQLSVDASAQEIMSILAQLTAALAEQGPNVVVQEVQVEVPPQDDYCNIGFHKVWPVLFFISLAINVGLVVLIVVYINKRKQSLKDDTPLVDYDIDDDF